MPASFFRRIMWRTFKYALVYHVLLGKAEAVIDAEDVGWAVRVAGLHLADARRLLDGYRLTDLEKVVVKAEAVQARLGRRPTKRELISDVRGIKNNAMAMVHPRSHEGASGRAGVSRSAPLSGAQRRDTMTLEGHKCQRVKRRKALVFKAVAEEWGLAENLLRNEINRLLAVPPHPGGRR